MPKGTLDIQRKIKSITSTKKVTKAMEMVSGAKMRKAVSAVLASRPYATAATAVLAGLHHIEHPFFTQRTSGKSTLIVISSNRGLCGSFNSAVAQAALRYIHEHEGNVDVYTYGRRAAQVIAATITITADYPKADITRSSQDIVPMVHEIIRGFLSGTYNTVDVISTDFISPLAQTVSTISLLPMKWHTDTTSSTESDILFEPSPSAVLDMIIPRILETRVFQAVLDSEASEHSARMLAMKNASEAATDLLSSLNSSYNRMRQAAITQEIAEISAGRAALE